VEVCLYSASQQASFRLAAAWVVTAADQHGYHWMPAADVPQVAAAVAVGPCSQVEVLWQMLAANGRGIRLCSPCPTCCSSLLGMGGILFPQRPRAAQDAPAYPCLGSHRPLATPADRPGAPIS
jgi:hypothetical protein